MSPQNLLNIAWAIASLEVENQPLMKSIAAASIARFQYLLTSHRLPSAELALTIEMSHFLIDYWQWRVPVRPCMPWTAREERRPLDA
mmetsp:Transcript_29710/g.46383  ORF Transcript_29710/g.46383 Transcript_29710/m.46383 type:complete len:87 (-) Transcript_29710:44-304(-)